MLKILKYDAEIKRQNRAHYFVWAIIMLFFGNN